MFPDTKIIDSAPFVFIIFRNSFLPKKEVNAELIRRYIRRLVIVYARMSTDGKLQKLSIRESPDVRFSRPILATLNHWSFRPAQLNGQVALKVLIGIPILPFE